MDQTERHHVCDQNLSIFGLVSWLCLALPWYSCRPMCWKTTPYSSSWLLDRYVFVKVVWTDISNESSFRGCDELTWEHKKNSTDSLDDTLILIGAKRRWDMQEVFLSEYFFVAASENWNPGVVEMFWTSCHLEVKMCHQSHPHRDSCVESLRLELGEKLVSQPTVINVSD